MKNKIKEKLKHNSSLLRIVALFHNLCYFNLPLTGNFQGAFLKKTNFSIKGKHTSIFCGEKSRLNNCLFHINGDNIKIHIGENCILSNLELWIEDNNGEIKIGSNTTVEGGHFAATEGEKIIIGSDCMFSSNIQIRNGDSHPTFDVVSGKRLNYASSIRIGDHVWLGYNSTILKGSVIASNSIVGTGAIVSGKCIDENSIYVGTPAKKVKESIRWERHR